MTILTMGIIPRREALTTVDVTEVDLAAQIRRGDVTWQEVARRMERDTFNAWMKWRGLDVLERGLKEQRSRCAMTLSGFIKDIE